METDAVVLREPVTLANCILGEFKYRTAFHQVFVSGMEAVRLILFPAVTGEIPAVIKSGFAVVKEVETSPDRPAGVVATHFKVW